MNDKKNKIEALKANGYQLEFENVFNLAFENYKKIALYAGLIIFVFSILIVILLSTGMISYLGITAFTDMMKPDNLNSETMSENNKTLIMFATIIGMCLLSPFPAGLIKMAHAAQNDDAFQVSTVFSYYKAPYFKELAIASLLIALFNSLVNVGITYLGVPYLEIIISTLISFVTMLTIPLIIFSDLKAIDALTSGVILLFKQPLTLLGLFVVSYIASLIGIFGCCIGIFFTMPIMYSLYFAIYSQIVGFDETNIDDESN